MQARDLLDRAGDKRRRDGGEEQCGNGKIGSDVNHFFFHILPLLQRGVYVHFHDIWYPFEYPREWLSRGIFWNEAYMLRTFLMDNPNFEIVMFNNFILRCEPDVVKRDFPRFAEQPGASLWLRRR